MLNSLFFTCLGVHKYLHWPGTKPFPSINFQIISIASDTGKFGFSTALGKIYLDYSSKSLKHAALTREMTNFS